MHRIDNELVHEYHDLYAAQLSQIEETFEEAPPEAVRGYMCACVDSLAFSFAQNFLRAPDDEEAGNKILEKLSLDIHAGLAQFIKSVPREQRTAFSDAEHQQERRLRRGPAGT